MINNKIRKIAYAGILIAISIVMTRLLSTTIVIAGVQGLRLSFGEIPLILSGILLGPLYGAVSGALADLIGYPINPTGPYFPGFTLSATLVGFLPGVIAKFVRKDWNWISLSIVISITILITSVILNTIWINMLYGRAVVVLLPPRIIASFIMVPIYVVVVNILLKRLKYFRTQL